MVGRLLVLLLRSDQEPRVEILDVQSGATRTFSLPEDPFRCVWSPSGRKLIAYLVGGSFALRVAP